MIYYPLGLDARRILAYKLIKLSQLAIYRETALISFDNPDYVAFAHACGADGYAVN